MCAKFPEQSRNLAYFLLPPDMLNINLDLSNPKQHRALVCYLFLGSIDLDRVKHANYLHFNQMIRYFISRGFCIDTCFCMDNSAYNRLKNRQYDVIVGFGPAYEVFCRSMDIPKRVLFVTENNPVVVAEKYKERIAYFKMRHPNITTKEDHVRNEYYRNAQFDLSNSIILMNSSYNAKSFYDYGSKVYTINANAIFNDCFFFEERKIATCIPKSKKNFLWFGSLGFIHKGVDIVLDAFSELPDFTIDLYGVSKSEINLYKKLAPRNARICGYMNVMSQEFIDEVVYQHCFLIFPSCSEGMSTAVCTCMAHGIIPIVTKECGFEPHESIIELLGWQVDDIKKALIRAANMSDENILCMRKAAYEYARKAFNIKSFSDNFSKAMDEILN